MNEKKNKKRTFKRPEIKRQGSLKSVTRGFWWGGKGGSHSHPMCWGGGEGGS